MKLSSAYRAIPEIIRGIPIEKLTLFAILIVGLFYLFIFPPNTAPDESTHLRSAYHNVGAIFGEVSEEAADVAMRAADADMIDKYPDFPNSATYELLGGELFKPLPPGGGEIIDTIRETGVPHPYIYFPQTAGMLIARVFNLNAEWLFLLGRIFNLVFFAFSVWLSIKLAPFGKGVFAVIALYPMAMHLAASLNSDTYTISLALLAFAQYLRIAYAEEPARIRDLVLMLLTMALLSPPKVIFLPMMMLAFFLPGRCFSKKKTAVIFRLAVVGVFILTTFITYYAYIHRGDGGAPIITFFDIEVYTLTDLIADPVLFAKTCKRTLEVYLGYFLHSMIGSDLGWIEIPINKMVINVFLALSVIGAFRLTATERILMIRDRVQFFSIFFLAALGTAVIMFVSWTPVGSWDIIGIQGRYFLPAFPLFILFAARWKKPVRPSWLSDKTLVLIACGLQVFVLVSAYLFISGRDPIIL